MRTVTTEEFRQIDKVARDLLNRHADHEDFPQAEDLPWILDAMQDHIESATIEPVHIRRSEENAELLEARVCQLLVRSAMMGGWNDIDTNEHLWS